MQTSRRSSNNGRRRRKIRNNNNVGTQSDIVVEINPFFVVLGSLIVSTLCFMIFSQQHILSNQQDDYMLTDQDRDLACSCIDDLYKQLLLGLDILFVNFAAFFSLFKGENNNNKRKKESIFHQTCISFFLPLGCLQHRLFFRHSTTTTTSTAA